MAWYRAGTVGVTNGSAVVTGAGTAWVANVQIGHAINLPDGRAYEVQSVDSNTQITLGSSYLGATANAQGYSVQPNQGFSQQAATLLQNFINQYGGYLTGSLSGRFGDGSPAAPGIAFAGDPDTGLTRNGSNVLAFVCGGSIAAYLAAAGLVCDPGFRTGIHRVYSAATETLTFQIGSSPSYLSMTNLGGGHVMVDGSIGDLFVGAAGTPVFLFNGGSAGPNADNTVSGASAAKRYSQLFAATSTIGTSDGREKAWRGGLTADELAAAKAIAATIGVFQFNDSVAEKGEDGARLHVGVIAQTVVGIMTDHGLDPMRYGFVCHDAWNAIPAIASRPAVDAELDEHGEEISPAVPAFAGVPAVPAGDRYGIRYEELAMFLTAAQEQRLLVAEGRLALLEAKAA